MVLEFNKERIIKRVYEICRDRKVEVKHCCAQSTNSIYFWVTYSSATVKFRISDHAPREESKSKCLLITNHSKIKLVERFTENRIAQAKKLSLKFAFAALQTSAV